MTPDGVPLGQVTAVINHGAGDVLEIAPADGARLLIAFTKQAVPDIDFAARRIVVAPPPEID